MNISDFQKSERDFAFVIDKFFKSQDLMEIISNDKFKQTISEVVYSQDPYDSAFLYFSQKARENNVGEETRNDSRTI